MVKDRVTTVVVSEKGEVQSMQSDATQYGGVKNFIVNRLKLKV